MKFSNVLTRIKMYNEVEHQHSEYDIPHPHIVNDHQLDSNNWPKLLISKRITKNDRPKNGKSILIESQKQHVSSQEQPLY